MGVAQNAASAAKEFFWRQLRRSARKIPAMWRSIVLGIICCGVQQALFAAAAQNAAAQNVQVFLEPRKGSVDDIFELRLTVIGRSKTDISPPAFAASRSFSISSTGTSSKHHFINGVQRSEVTFSYQIEPNPRLTPGQHELPPAQMAIDGKTVKLDIPPLTILPADTSHETRQRAASGIDFTQLVDNPTPFAGEQITYRAEVAADASFMGGTLEDIEFTGFWREDISGNEKQTRRAGSITVRSFLEVLIPKKDGPLEIPPRILTAKIQAARPSPRRSGGGLFSDPFFADDLLHNWSLFDAGRTISKRLTAAPVRLNVRPLPPPPMPYPGYIPTGMVKLATFLDKRKVNQGESVTLRLVLTGDGNLRPLELPEQSAQDSAMFKRYDDKPDLKTEFDNGKVLFTKTFNIALVALSPGEHPLPVFKFLTFNPKTESHELLETPPKTITVLPGAVEEQNRLAAANRAAQSAADTPADKRKEITIVAEDLLPQHIGAAALSTQKEFSGKALAAIILAAPLCSLALFFFLAQRRRLRDDPALLKQKNAGTQAFLALAALRGAQISSSGLAAGLRAALYNYLGDRLRSNIQGLTAQECAALLRRTAQDDSLAQAFAALFERCERLLYSGATAPAPEHGALLAEGEKLIAALEERLKTRRK